MLAMRSHSLRWVAVSLFILSTTLNYLDRTLSSVLAPLIKAEFHINNQQFGWLISAFSILYAAASLPAGWMLDRLGVTRGMTIAAGIWSTACAGMGFVAGVSSMAVCRGILGLGEAASVPAFGKVNALYLEPEERALGAALNGVGISIGSAVASFSIGWALVHGWRSPFVISGVVGFAWIPIWWLTSRWIPPTITAKPATSSGGNILAKGSLIALMLANVLWISGYSLWTNWTTIYLMEVHHISLADTKSLVWIPPIVSNAGGFFGGWLSMRLVKNAIAPVIARRRAIWWSALGCITALGLLFCHSAQTATVFISLSFFFVLAGSVNLYALPIDLFGAGKAGLAVAALTCGYGVLQAVISPVIGWLGDHHLYAVPVYAIVVAPLLASLLLLKVRI